MCDLEKLRKKDAKQKSSALIGAFITSFLGAYLPVLTKSLKQHTFIQTQIRRVVAKYRLLRIFF